MARESIETQSRISSIVVSLSSKCPAMLERKLQRGRVVVLVHGEAIDCVHALGKRLRACKQDGVDVAAGLGKAQLEMLATDHPLFDHGELVFEGGRWESLPPDLLIE